MRARLILAAVIIVAACAAVRVTASSGQAVDIPATSGPAILYTAAARYDALAWMRGADRFASGATIKLFDGKQARPLVTGFFATADPDVSFDGKSVLFAGKKSASDRWQIWEMQLPSGTPRRVITVSEDTIRPFYLPENKIVFARKLDGRFVIQSASLHDGKPVQLTYTPANVLPTDILRDGRILFSVAQWEATRPTPEIYTVYSDGSGVESYRCDHGKARYSARQIDDEIVFTRGRALAKFTSPLASESAVNAPAGEYAGDIVKSASGEWLTSWRANGAAQYELRRWKPGDSTLAPLAKEAGLNIVQPIVLTARTVPNRHPSGLHDWKYANLMALSVYTSKYRIASGSVASVRVSEKDSVSVQPRVLGTAPVESDGSFFIRVPGDKAIRFELLDNKGRVLQQQHGWMWARSGEQRICVGCHIGPEQSPENAVPAILQRSVDPTDLTGAKKSQQGGN